MSKGGHNIPANVVKRRYNKGLENLNIYKNITDNWYIYDNSGTEYLPVAKCIDNKKEIFNFDVYNKITPNDAKKEK